MRFAIVCLALVACSAPDRAGSTHTTAGSLPSTAPSTPASSGIGDGAPGLRLPAGTTPLAYDVTLDVDPDSETFLGEVHIRIRLDKPTARIWIHADQLDIATAKLDDVAIDSVPVRGDQMLGFTLARPAPAGEHVLSFTYTGRTTGDQEGLFRQKSGERWYLFSQGESVFARRIVPCFDEPQFKTPFRVTLVVPKSMVALANTPEESVTVAGGKKKIRFAETPRMPSYLLTIAVGPFDLVDAGTVGSQKVPVRVVVRAGAGTHATVVASTLPAIVSAMEAYVGTPLPLKKLDFVAVSEFFGAMENPGLITAESNMLVGKETKQRVVYFTVIAAHEIAHQWFGNQVTPAWWDDLWLSESFASWLGDKVAGKLGAFDERPLHAVNERREALEADGDPTALPLHRAIEGNEDPEDAFDAIAYQKGQAVLASFEALVGEDAFRSIVRTYLEAHAGGNATAGDFTSALGTATKPELGTAFAQYTQRAGVPVVDMTLRCDGSPAVVAAARDSRLVPVCVRYAGGSSPACALVGTKTEIAIGRACPAWLTGNAHAGYYYVHWQNRAASQDLDKLDIVARALVGDDVAATFARGELPAKDALAELRTMLAGDLQTQVAAIPLAKEIDELIDTATRPAWSKWLAARLPKLKRGTKASPLALQLVAALQPLVLPADRFAPDARKKTRVTVGRMIARREFPDHHLLASVSTFDSTPLFDAIVDNALAARDPGKRERWLRLLGVFPSELADRTAALAVDKRELPIDPIWLSLEHYFDRPAARKPAWDALRPRLDTFMKRASHRGPDIIAAASLLCDRTSRTEVAKAFEPYLARIVAGRAHLDRALAAIDQCIARRTRVGDLAAAIATSP